MIEENALSYCKLFISSLIWIRQGVSVAWPWCSRFYCLALAVSSARWEFLKLSASLIQTTLGYHKTGKCLHAFSYVKKMPNSIEQLQVNTLVLIFCLEFQELSHLTCDLSQAEKKINVVCL